MKSSSQGQDLYKSWSDVQDQLANNVKSLHATKTQHGGAFAALKNDGSVISWGHNKFGGDCSMVQDQLSCYVESVYANEYAFVALKQIGSVIAWGQPTGGGDCSEVQEYLNKGVKSIYQTGMAFAALKIDGSVFAWGEKTSGGDCSSVQHQLTRDVHSIYRSRTAFAALKIDGTVVAWGEKKEGVKQAESIARAAAEKALQKDPRGKTF